MSGMGLRGAGGLALVLLHGVALAATFSAFGCLLFFAFLAPSAAMRLEAAQVAVSRLSLALPRWSLLIAVILELGWLLGLSGFVAGAASVGQAGAALLVIVRNTGFGQIAVAQIVLLLTATFFLGRGRRGGFSAALAGLATSLEAWRLHGAVMRADVSPLFVSELLHVLAAGAWLGGLLPLALFIRAAPPEAGALAARRFSHFATPCVFVLAATALWQGRNLLGSLSAALSTQYGWIALAKLGLFGLLLLFAVRHRWRLTPALSGAGADFMRRAFARSIFAETAFGIAVVLVSAIIASLAPPADMDMARRVAEARSTPRSIAGDQPHLQALTADRRRADRQL